MSMGFLTRSFLSILPIAFRRNIKQRLLDYCGTPSNFWSFCNMRQLGFSPKLILDVGAYKGEWTTMMRRIYPSAFFLMLEAQEERIPDLERIKILHPDTTAYRIALLGAEQLSSVVFHQCPTAPTSCSILQARKGGNFLQVNRPMRTIDSMLKEFGSLQPDLIKLDIQGYELEALKGASLAIEKAQAILMEVSLIDMYHNNPLLHAVTEFMNDRDFVAYDISALMRRPLDMALAQVDIIFVPRNSPLIKHKEYGSNTAI
jgi:FkbM family methyltransferase